MEILKKLGAKKLLERFPNLEKYYLKYRKWEKRRRNHLRFRQDLKTYFEMNNNPNFILQKSDLYPRWEDYTEITTVGADYFYQETWAMGKILEAHPSYHVDIGSRAIFVGLLSKAVHTTMVDIRPLPVQLDSLNFKKGSILILPFDDNSLESVSSLCVIEHIGLGRYGDELDYFGSEKAIAELKRVIKPGGNLYISVPVEKESRVYFNAHRVFSLEYLETLITGFKLMERKFVYGDELKNEYEPYHFGTVLLHLVKK